MFTYKALILSFAILISILGCSSKSIEEPKMEKITPHTRLFSLEDFISVGFKKNKTYKVDELPKATSAYFGFIRFNEPANDGKGKKVVEYELRFYDSHIEAVEYGFDYAEERVGPDAKLKKTHNPRWKEGLRYARLCLGDQFNTWKNSADCARPKFNEFYIYGNVVILCEGRRLEVAKKNCNSISYKLELLTETN